MRNKSPSQILSHLRSLMSELRLSILNPKILIALVDTFVLSVSVSLRPSVHYLRHLRKYFPYFTCCMIRHLIRHIDLFHFEVHGNSRWALYWFWSEYTCCKCFKFCLYERLKNPRLLGRKTNVVQLTIYLF